MGLSRSHARRSRPRMYPFNFGGPVTFSNIDQPTFMHFGTQELSEIEYMEKEGRRPRRAAVPMFRLCA
jgi:hypothetical protein